MSPKLPYERPAIEGLDGFDAAEVIEDMKGFVREVEEERKKEAAIMPKDLFGVVSLLPRRLMGVALVFALMAGSGLATYIATMRKATSDDESATVKMLVEQARSMDRRVSIMEVVVADVRGTGERNEREIKAMSTTLARIEGKLDRALR